MPLQYPALHCIVIQSYKLPHDCNPLDFLQKVWSVTIGIRSGIPLLVLDQPWELPTMSSSQKLNTCSASRSEAVWVLEGGTALNGGSVALGKPVLTLDAEQPLGLPIAVVDAAGGISPATAHEIRNHSLLLIAIWHLLPTVDV